jgi:hypothetical protein
MKILLALLLPAPLLAAITPIEIGGLFVVLSVVGFALNQLLGEHLRRKKLEQDIARFFERRARNSRSIRL